MDQDIYLIKEIMEFLGKIQAEIVMATLSSGGLDDEGFIMGEPTEITEDKFIESI